MKKGETKNNTIAYSAIAVLLLVVIGVTITGNSIFDWFFDDNIEEEKLESFNSEEFEENNIEEETIEKFDGKTNEGSNKELSLSNEILNDESTTTVTEDPCEPDGKHTCDATSKGQGTTPKTAVALATLGCNEKLAKCPQTIENALAEPKKKCEADIGIWSIKYYSDIPPIGPYKWDCEPTKTKITELQLCTTSGIELVQGGGVCIYETSCFDEEWNLKTECEPTSCRKRTADDPESGTWIATATSKRHGSFVCIGAKRLN